MEIGGVSDAQIGLVERAEGEEAPLKLDIRAPMKMDAAAPVQVKMDTAAPVKLDTADGVAEETKGSQTKQEATVPTEPTMAEEPEATIRGGCYEDEQGVWRHPEQPEHAPWSTMTTDAPRELAAWQRGAWPGIGGIEWEGAKEVFRDFNEPSTVFAPDEAFFAKPCIIDDRKGTYDPGWATRPRDEMEVQGRFLGFDGEFVDWPKERERIFGKPPRRRDDATWQRPKGAGPEVRAPWAEYKAKVTVWYQLQKELKGTLGTLDPAYVDLCFMTDDGEEEYALRRVLVDCLTRGCTDTVSVDACGSHAPNLKSATEPARRLVWDAHMAKEIAGGWVRHWDLGPLLWKIKFLCPLGLVAKPPDIGEIDESNPDHWRLIRHFSKGIRSTSINERFPYDLKPRFVDYAGGADAVEGLIWLRRRDPDCDPVMFVLDLSKMYRSLPMQACRFHHYCYDHPGEGLMYDCFGPFGLAVIGHFAMYLSVGMTWAHRHVELPLLLPDGEPVPDYALNVFVDDFAGFVGRGNAPPVRQALVNVIRGVGFGFRGKLQDGIGASNPNLGVADDIRVWIGVRIDCALSRARCTANLIDKCIRRIQDMLAADSPPTDQLVSELTGRLQFGAWTTAELRPALRVIWDMLSVLRRDYAAPWRQEWLDALTAWLTTLSDPGGVPGIEFGHYACRGWSDGLVIPMITDAQPGNGLGSQAPGIGIFIGGFFVHAQIPASVMAWASEHMPTKQPDNNMLESIGQMAGAMIIEVLLPGCTTDYGVPLAALTDSAVSRCVRGKGASRCTPLNDMMRAFNKAVHGIIDGQRLQIRQVTSEGCFFADPGSRWHIPGQQTIFWDQVADIGRAAGIDIDEAGAWRRDAVAMIDLPDSWMMIGMPNAPPLTPLHLPRAPTAQWAQAYRMQWDDLQILPAEKAFGRPGTGRRRRLCRRANVLPDSPTGSPGR